MIKIPGKRYGKRLQRSIIFGEGAPAKKSGFSDLLITPLVDMFVIILLFLIANFSATGEILSMQKDIILPEAKNVQEVEMVPVILLSEQEIIVDGTSVARLSDLDSAEYLNIPALEEKLRELKRKQEDLHTAAGDADSFKGDINIQGHKEVKFRYVKKVMFSAATAGFGNINFAVLSKGDGAEGAPAAAAATAPTP